MNRKLIIILLYFGVACDPVPPFGEIPIIPFPDIFVNTNLPQYSALRINGGVVAIDGGVRGILLYRENEFSYKAFERNCSFTPNEACATVDVDGSQLFMIDSCCGSTFSFPNGMPAGGPAIYSLRQYEVIVDGSNLTITDFIIN